MIKKVLVVLGWVGFIILVILFLIAVRYKGDPVVDLAVRQIFVGIAGWVSDTRDLKKAIELDIKKDLKEEVNHNKPKGK